MTVVPELQPADEQAEEPAVSDDYGIPAPEGLTEAYAAERFVQCNRNFLRYDHRRKKWFVYQYPLWRPDPDGQVTREAIEAARSLLDEAGSLVDSKAREKTVSFAKMCLSWGGIKRILEIARNLPPIANIGGEWDLDPWLLGTPNGVIDLHTGRLRQGRPEDMITLAVRVAYDPSAKCPEWKKFIKQICRGDKELIRYVQRALGYSLTGLTTEQVWFLLYGTGANGKSTFINVLAHVLGDHAKTIPFSTVQLPERSIPNDIAGRVSARVS